MKKVRRVEIPQEAFLAVLKVKIFASVRRV